MKRTILTLAIISLISIFSLSAQNQFYSVKFTIKGEVIDSLSMETIPYASLDLYEQGNLNSPTRREITDMDGKFSIILTKAGKYELVIDYIGKEQKRIAFETTNEGIKDLGAIYMKDNLTLDEIVIVAQRPLVQVDLDKISYNIENDPEAKTSNVMEMLKKVPMVTVDGEDNIQLKGSSNYMIYLNGKPSTLIASNPKDVLKSMPANTIKDIEVITDPGAKYDAEGVAGIINIITQDNSSLNGYTVSVNAGVNHRGGFNGGTYFSIKQGKLGFTGNFNYYDYKNPKGETSYYREDLSTISPNPYKYLHQRGTNKGDGNGLYGTGEISYEIDSLNLINLNFSRYGGTYNGDMRMFVEQLNEAHQNTYSYQRDADMKYTYGSTSVNLDYQRTFSKVKDRLLTISYRFDQSPNDMDYYTQILNSVNFAGNDSKQFSDAESNEHVFQADFTTPIGKSHTIEAGLKYTKRFSKSNSGQSIYNNMNVWEDIQSDNDKFKYDQDIMAAYAGYSYKYGKWGIKSGLRFEGTWLDAKFPIDQTNNFDSDYTNLVPSVTATYMIQPTQTIRAGYNMRIQRPGIWRLNPYLNTTDSTNISQGNPDLDAVRYNTFSLNYSYFHTKVNLNLNASYSFTNNSIESYTEKRDNGVLYTSYYNIGKNRSFNLSGYVNWRITNNLNFYSNLSGSYHKIKSTEDNSVENDGFSSSIYGGLQYSLPLDFTLSVGGFYMSSPITLQGESSEFYNYNFSIAKDFLNKKLNIRLTANNPFTKHIEYKSKQSTVDFLTESINNVDRQAFGISISYRFGEMKSQIKKAKRGISTEDSDSDNRQGGTGGGQQGLPQ